MGCALYIRYTLSIHQKECRKSLGCALSTGKYGILNVYILWYLIGLILGYLLTPETFDT
jgi:hypothetical protein